MTTEEARTILLMLCDGIDPTSGEVLPDDHFCNDPSVIRALHKALMHLPGSDISFCPNQEIELHADSTVEPSFFNHNGRLNAGRPWTTEDLNTLSQLFQEDVPIDAMCDLLQRRKRGIQKALVSLGLVEDTQKTKPGRERAGQPWTQGEFDQLEQLVQQKLPLAEIAQRMHRSEYAIFCKMEQRGLTGEVPGYPTLTIAPRWTSEDRNNLREMYRKGATLSQLAAHFERSEDNIAGHLFYMGLRKESPLPALRSDAEES